VNKLDIWLEYLKNNFGISQVYVKRGLDALISLPWAQYLMSGAEFRE